MFDRRHAAGTAIALLVAFALPSGAAAQSPVTCSLILSGQIEADEAERATCRMLYESDGDEPTETAEAPPEPEVEESPPPL